MSCRVNGAVSKSRDGVCVNTSASREYGVMRFGKSQERAITLYKKRIFTLSLPNNIIVWQRHILY